MRPTPVVEPVVEPVDVDAPPLSGPVLMNQDWRDLTFVHWAVDPARVAPLMPPTVRPDVLDGVTYVGLVPFRMVDAGVGRRGSVPWLGTFLETNVRLYSVDEAGRRGVVFLSLDADRLGVVAGARLAFNLPYRWARMSHEASAGVHTYSSTLRRPGGRDDREVGVDLAVRVGSVREPSPLDEFLSARWRLHTAILGRPVLVPNRHGRWPLHDAEVVRLHDRGLLADAGFGDLATRPPDQVAFSPGVHTEFGLPRRAARRSSPHHPSRRTTDPTARLPS